MDQQINIGGVSFGLATTGIDDIARSASAIWANLERIGNRPSKQFTGLGDDTLVINGLWAADIHGENVIPALRALMNKGNPVLLMFGDGVPRGLWCIDVVDSKADNLTMKGEARKIAFTVNLSYFSA